MRILMNFIELCAIWGANCASIGSMKLAVGGVQYKNLSVKTTFFGAIQLLYQYYTNTGDCTYLEISLLYIQAYLEMGFAYEWGTVLFDKILNTMKTNRELEFPKRIYNAKTVKLNKSQVKKMIKKWRHLHIKK